MILHDHSRVIVRALGQGKAEVIERKTGRKIGTVKRSQDYPGRWAYLHSGQDDGVFTAPYATRKDAVDNLLSYDSPSAPWLI